MRKGGYSATLSVTTCACCQALALFGGVSVLMLEDVQIQAADRTLLDAHPAPASAPAQLPKSRIIVVVHQQLIFVMCCFASGFCSCCVQMTAAKAQKNPIWKCNKCTGTVA